jgi:hypothetical protein
MKPGPLFDRRDFADIVVLIVAVVCFIVGLIVAR